MGESDSSTVNCGLTGNKATLALPLPEEASAGRGSSGLRFIICGSASDDDAHFVTPLADALVAVAEDGFVGPLLRGGGGEASAAVHVQFQEVEEAFLNAGGTGQDEG